MAGFAFRRGSDARVAIRALLAGTLVLASIGSCELPKPQIPSIGALHGSGSSAGAVAGWAAHAAPGTAARPAAACPAAAARPAAAL